MNYWDILGIAFTDDIVTIKKAYAAKAKEYHPEEHPEEFKRLQDAYKQALNYAKFHKIVKKAQESKAANRNNMGVNREPDWEEEQEAAPETVCDYDYAEIQKTREDPVAQLWEEFQFIKWHPALRNRREMWRYYFHQPEHEQLFFRDEVRRQFVQLMVKEKPVNWHVQTIKCMTGLLERFQIESWEESARETMSEEWTTIRAYASNSDRLLTTPFLTNKERKFFCQVEGTRELLAGKQVSIQKYWNDYTAFARTHREQLEEWYRRNTKKRGRMPLFVKVIGVCFIMLLLALILFFSETIYI